MATASTSDLSLGVHVGRLHVPHAHMAAVKAALAAEGRAGRPWLRQNGVRSTPDVLHVHLTVEGATCVASGRSIPPPIQALLEANQIRWEPGVRPPPATPLAPPPPPPPGAAFTFAELFAGIGGFRVGLEALGGHCVFASELDPHAAATYEANFGAPPDAGDITEVPSDAFPAHDLLVGGFPCQPFATAGERRALADPRGQLYLEVCRVLCARKPAAFLLENVAALYTMGGGTFAPDYADRTPGAVVQTIVRAFEACGYTVSVRIVGAHQFGVPQFRDRLYFVGFLDAARASRFSWPEGTTEHDHLRCEPNVRSVLEPPDSVAVAAAALSAAQRAKVAEGLADGSRVARLDGRARTLIANYRHGWHRDSEFVVDGSGVRFYTCREALRLMGFPESWAVAGWPNGDRGGKALEAYQRSYRQIGNAVCPPVITAIAREVMRAAGFCS